MKRKKTSLSVAFCLSLIFLLIFVQSQPVNLLKASAAARPEADAAGFYDVKTLCRGWQSMDTAINKAIASRPPEGGTLFSSGKLFVVSICRATLRYSIREPRFAADTAPG